MTDVLHSQLAELQVRYAALQDENRVLRAEQQQHLHQQRTTNTLEQVFFRMAERATAGLSFYAFVQSLHALLGELMTARNCYVCLYNAQRQTMDFPYYVDERDGDSMQNMDVPMRRGLTEYVLRSRTAQLIDSERFAQLQASGDVTQASGDLSFSSWLGVPMQLRGTLGGVLVVQSYDPSVHYSLQDAEVLRVVANHFGSAIERYQALEALQISEERYRKVLDNVGVGVVVVQDGRMVFANPSMVRIVGHPMDYLLSHHFTATIHPDDVTAVVQRHQRRLAGESVESFYGFRVITSSGEVRPLELSAVTLQWERRDATLLFVVDATARLLAEVAQRQALQQQIELNDMKARFIAMASHEFRTPLAAIHGSVELLTHYDDRLPPERKRHALTKIDDAVERMTHMLENVLVIGRTDAGHLQFRPKPLALHAFCQGMVDEVRSVLPAEFARVQLTLDLCSEATHYVLDEALMRNIVGNLLSNAIKYSPQGGNVRLSVEEHTGHIRLSVHDQGLGIPQEDQAHLFENFYRAANVGQITGTGLGLAIVRAAVQRHLGSVELTSTVGQGSTFTVTLPTERIPDIPVASNPPSKETPQ
jgi:PAS domain S-box-containing protein